MCNQVRRYLLPTQYYNVSLQPQLITFSSDFRPLQGSSLTTFKRLLPANYENQFNTPLGMYLLCNTYRAYREKIHHVRLMPCKVSRTIWLRLNHTRYVLFKTSIVPISDLEFFNLLLVPTYFGVPFSNLEEANWNSKFECVTLDFFFQFNYSFHEFNLFFKAHKCPLYKNNRCYSVQKVRNIALNWHNPVVTLMLHTFRLGPKKAL